MADHDRKSAGADHMAVDLSVCAVPFIRREGIDRISKAADETLPGLTDRLKALREAARNYNSYSGISKDMDGTVKFIYVFDGTDE